jgi:hypothetical protein
MLIRISVLMSAACSLQEFDGASRGNPGLAGAGAAILEDESRQEVLLAFEEHVRLPVVLRIPQAF